MSRRDKTIISRRHHYREHFSQTKVKYKRIFFWWTSLCLSIYKIFLQISFFVVFFFLFLNIVSPSIYCHSVVYRIENTFERSLNEIWRSSLALFSFLNCRVFSDGNYWKSSLWDSLFRLMFYQDLTVTKLAVSRQTKKVIFNNDRNLMSIQFPAVKETLKNMSLNEHYRA